MACRTVFSGDARRGPVGSGASLHNRETVRGEVETRAVETRAVGRRMQASNGPMDSQPHCDSRPGVGETKVAQFWGTRGEACTARNWAQ